MYKIHDPSTTLMYWCMSKECKNRTIRNIVQYNSEVIRYGIKNGIVSHVSYDMIQLTIVRYTFEVSNRLTKLYMEIQKCENKTLKPFIISI